MDKYKRLILLSIILLLAALLRFYNLMHDAPYFFNPDERNMAIAISQFKLPAKIPDIPACVLSQFHLYPKPYTLNPASCNLNPRFYAYGQFPLYLAFASDQITKPVINFFLKQPTTHLPLRQADNPQLITVFPSAVFWLRFWSAFSSALTVLFVYLITKQLICHPDPDRNREKNPLRFQNHDRDSSLKLRMTLIPYLATLTVSFTPGLIQSAHFGTTESLLTFFFLGAVYSSLKFLEIPPLKSFRGHFIHNSKFIILSSAFIGLAAGTKLTGIFSLAPPFISLTIHFIKTVKKQKKNLPGKILKHCGIGILIIFFSLIFSIMSSPYNLINKQGFLGSVFGYERDVAVGKYEAFYTRQFVDTVPVLFQTKKVFPYALGWPVFILGTLGFLFVSLQLLLKLHLSFIQRLNKQEVRIKNHSIYTSHFLLLTSFLVYFLPNAFLFAKWTRFMTPVFPFFSIFAAAASFQILHFSSVRIFQTSNVKRKTAGKTWILLFVLRASLCALIMIPGLAFMSIYTHEDSRLTASRWIYKNIPNNSYILSETANVVDIPLTIPDQNPTPETHNLNVISFDFYHLEENPQLFHQLLDHLAKSDYIFIPSRRIFMNFQRFPGRYPLVNKYYQLLFSGKLGFEKVAEINSFPSFLLLNSNLQPANYNLQTILTFPDESAEETFTVFDHPVIRIYRKVRPSTQQEYKSLFKEQ